MAGRTDNQDGTVLVAVGDAHGRADLVTQLIGKAERRYEGREVRFVFLGDYVDRGPDSRGVLDALIELQARRPDTVLLKGNHEQAMLDFIADPEEGEAWIEWGGEETMASYGVARAPGQSLEDLRDQFAEAMPDLHFALLMDLTVHHREGNLLFVHAGLNPDRALDDQREKDMLWVRDEWRKNGKGRFPGLTVVHGHTPVPKPENHAWRVNVDTGAVWSSRLTALCVDGGKRSFLATG